MKKFLALLLCLTMFIAVMSSCSPEADGGSDTTSPDTNGDTVEDVADIETPSEDDTTAQEAPPAEEVVQEEKEPEPEEVEEAPAPKEYEYTSVFKVDFSTMEDVYFADLGEGEALFDSRNTEDLRIEGGIMKGTSISGDPYVIYQGEMAVDAGTVQEVHIKLMNYSSDFNFQFFFTTETVSWSEPASVKDYLLYSALDEDDNDWNEIVIYPEESIEWTGTVTSFRLDPFSSEGDFEVASVEFFTVTEK